jgi:hypothetical protein
VLEKKRAQVASGNLPQQKKAIIKSSGPAPGTSRRRWWWKEMKQLTEAADVFVEVYIIHYIPSHTIPYQTIPYQ